MKNSFFKRALKSWPIVLALAFALSSLRANSQSAITNNLYGNVVTFGLSVNTNVSMELEILSPINRTWNGYIISNDPLYASQDTNGFFAFTNIVWGKYKLLANDGSGTAWTVTVPVTTNSVPIASLIGNAMLPPNPMTNYYTQAQVDALISGISAGSSTSVVATTNTTSIVFSGNGTITNPISATITNVPLSALPSPVVTNNSANVTLTSSVLASNANGHAQIFANGYLEVQRNDTNAGLTAVFGPFANGLTLWGDGGATLGSSTAGFNYNAAANTMTFDGTLNGSATSAGVVTGSQSNIIAAALTNNYGSGVYGVAPTLAGVVLQNSGVGTFSVNHDTGTTNTWMDSLNGLRVQPDGAYHHGYSFLTPGTVSSYDISGKNTPLWLESFMGNEGWTGILFEHSWGDSGNVNGFVGTAVSDFGLHGGTGSALEGLSQAPEAVAPALKRPPFVLT
ncbi:MAG: hypothetical protein KGL39_60055, partial [Patescibacteria group bacterium]|nr:hypothetical protein [Patescibacteria group bacterium]